MDLERTNLKVLMFPWLAYGHIFPYLNVAKKLVDIGFNVYPCSTPINLNLIKKNIPQKCFLSVHLVELHLPELPDIPLNYHTTNKLPPHLNSTLKKALKRSKTNFSRILENLKPDLLIYDVFQQWAKKVAYSHNVPAVILMTCNAASTSHTLHAMNKPGIEFPFPALYLTKIERARLEESIESNKLDKDPDNEYFSSGEDDIKTTLMSTSRVVEAKCIDYLAELSQHKIIPVGSLVQDIMINEDEMDGINQLIHWLEKKDVNSIVFVSFGSEYILTKDDLKEIAFGQELSQVNFIWVVSFSKEDEARLEEVLPESFLERIEDKGMVVDGWAPQSRILNHPSIGGFVSHCGWNSVKESIEFGVPIIAMPMHLDQPINARLMVALGVALEIVKDDEGKVHRGDVAQVIKSVICEETGENLRKKFKDISENLKSAEEEQMDAVVEELLHICKNNKCDNVTL